VRILNGSPCATGSDVDDTVAELLDMIEQLSDLLPPL
jgi:hypothetical protein